MAGDSAAVCWASQLHFTNDLAYAYSIDILHHYELARDLMKYWHQVLPDRIYDLDYEQLTENQENGRKLVDYLGLSGRCLFISGGQQTSGYYRI